MRGIRLALTGFVLILAGCSSSAEPETLEPISPSDSHSSAPSTAESEPSPDSPTDDVNSSATEFMTAFVDQSNRALATESELSAWRSMFASSCQVCVSGFESTKAFHEAGQEIQGGQWIDWSVNTQDESNGQAVVVVQGSIEAASVRDSSGRVTDTFEAVPDVTVVYTLKAQPNGEWLIVDGTLL